MSNASDMKDFEIIKEDFAEVEYITHKKNDTEAWSVSLSVNGFPYVLLSGRTKIVYAVVFGPVEEFSSPTTLCPPQNWMLVWI